VLREVRQLLHGRTEKIIFFCVMTAGAVIP
jgi:hypothetical protein